ncbi:shikimate 5-dehydrogenase [Paraoerskovia sediminicola]|uniref:Shikimate 5-dehydrogenase n=1 Tax=Paraoerskovia sediminicola TaxID=1138587 RepID=A0ABM8G5W3_9CELL|nr:shikimate dehydrogenase [Paraoerskovia sediminicola]BDZ43506.1 shikimate 5-dehydrogenase [Paraoerskovia sediminicola]
MTTSRPRRAAVLGHPVAHSLSPVLHRSAYAALGLDGWTYGTEDVTAEELPAFVAAMDESWCGLSLTMPLKHAVMPLLDSIDPLAEVVGAVNTLLPVANVRVGANTDVHGIVSALGEGLDGRTARSVTVLGAGATAASTLAALGELGCTTPSVLVRSLARTGDLRAAATRMGVSPTFDRLDRAVELMQSSDIVISTLPGAAADGIAAELGGASGPHTPAIDGLLLDVVYEPRPTALSAAWARRGGATVAGERMLLHQAAEQVRLMTGHAAPLAAMDAALSSALAA